MDSTRYTVTSDEFKIFHGIDRALYIILVRDLCRNPLECLQILGMWLWLERGGFCSVIGKILTLPSFLINELADEAVACLACINGQFLFSSVTSEIPLTHSLVDKDISLQFFHKNRQTISHGVRNLVSELYTSVLSDIMESACLGNFSGSSTRTPTTTISGRSLGRAGSSPSINQVRAPSSSNNPQMASGGRPRASQTLRNQRTLFVTFSRGYPVTEIEVIEFITRLHGNCIESVRMQGVRPNEQALYAIVVFFSPDVLRVILNGVDKVKFSINGKHVWMRKFVERT